jgi:hypothetical protein
VSPIQSERSETNRTLIAAFLWAFIPACASVVLGSFIPDVELKKVVYTGAGALFFGGFFSALVKVHLDDVVATKRRRDELAGFVSNVISDLKSAYDRVGRARILIPAHKSVKTYGDEMRAMIEARVLLRNVTRALDRRAAGVDGAVRIEVTRRVDQMETYLATLTLEFQDVYKPLSDSQRAYEERAKLVLDRYAKTDTADAPPALPGYVWESLRKLERLSDFIGSGETYRASFEQPLDDASELLRAELARILGEMPAIRSRRRRHNSDVAADEALGRCAPSGPRS